MGLFTLNEVFKQASGKYGDVVLQKNFRFRTNPEVTNPNTAAQIEARLKITTQSQNWKALTQTQRDSWNVAANAQTRVNRLSQEINMSGFQFFVSSNINLSLLSQSPITTPPNIRSVEGLENLSITISLGSSSVIATTSPSPGPSNSSFIISATKGLSPGISSSRNELRIIVVVYAQMATGFNLFSSYTDKYGTSSTCWSKSLLLLSIFGQARWISWSSY